MFPRLFTVPAFDLLRWHIGPLTLHTYGVLLALAFLAGLWVVSREAKRAGLDATVITDMAVYVLIGGLIGAKLLLLLVEWSYYSKHLGEIWTLLQSGGVFYGGLLGAFPVAWWFARRHWLIRALRMTRISVAELEQLRQSATPHAIYDVRAPESRQRHGAIPGAVPWSVDAKELPPAAASPTVEVVVYCDCPNDYSAAKVAYRLRQAGFTNVRPLYGGIDAWIAAGLPVERADAASVLG